MMAGETLRNLTPPLLREPSLLPKTLESPSPMQSRTLRPRFSRVIFPESTKNVRGYFSLKMENVCSYMTFYDLREKYPLTFFVLSGKITREKRGRSVLDCIGLGDARVFGSSEDPRT